MNESFRILKPFVRGLPIIALVMFLSVLGAKKYLSYLTPMYESTAKLKLADIGEGVPNSNLFKNFDVFASSNKISAEIEVLKSSKLITKTLASLDFNEEIYRVGDIQTVELYHNSPIIVKLLRKNGSVYDNRYRLLLKSKKEYEIYDSQKKLILKGRVNVPETFQDNKILVGLNPQVIRSKRNIKIFDTYEFEFLSDNKLIEKAGKNLDIVAVDKDVAVIRINFKSNIPQKASAFVNHLAGAYIEDYINTKYQIANTTVNFLNREIEEATEKLRMAEDKIEAYRNDKKVTNIQQETETDLRKISQLKIQQTNLRMNLEAIATLNRYIASGKDNFLSLAPNFEAFTDLLSTEIVKNIERLQAEKKDLLQTYTPYDSRISVIDLKIKDLTNYLEESIKNTERNLQVKYSQITMDIENAEKVFLTVPEKEKNLKIMERDFNLLQASYNFLNEKKIEAEIASSAKISFHRIITPATTEKQPISPNKPLIIILAALTGMVASIVFIYLVHVLKAKVNDSTTIEKNTSIPLAISTPYAKENQQEVFSKIVLQLQLKNILAKGKSLTVSTHGPGEGKCFNILHICKVLNHQNNTVMLIDAQGDMAFLKTGTPDGQQIYHTCFPKVKYFDLADASHYYSEEALSSQIASFKHTTDFIIINNAYLKSESRALLMMKITDNNLFVVDARQTALKIINRLELLKTEFNIPHIWFMLNKAGYSPNVIRQAGQLLMAILKKLKR
jgi:uncharacterized protein involved in exopolysaccharide biosynthesis